VDYRTPNIYDPSTLTEPYAYARANPVMFWDPNGLSWLGDFAKHSFEYFASGQAAENLTAFVGGAVDGTVGAVVQVLTETGNMAHDLGNVSYSVHKYALTGELHEFEMRSAIGKSAEQGNDGVAGAARNLGAMAKGAVTAPLEMGKDLTSGDPRRMGQGLAKLEVALAIAGARHGFTSPVSQVGRGVVQDIKSTATTILEKTKSLVSKKPQPPPSSITPSPTPAPNKIALGEQPRDAWGKFMSKTNPGQRTPGLSAVDDFAEKAKLNGFEIAGREVSVQTPFGLRRYDVVIRDKLTGLRTGVEIKSSRSAFRRFEAQQEAADKWLKMQGGLQAVGGYEGLKIDTTIKILWELP